jgi:hypothetical protein
VRVLTLQTLGAAAHSKISDAEVWRALDRHGLSSTPSAVDFYRMAAAVYSADHRVSRELAFDRWTRDLVLHLPVTDVAAWERALAPLKKLLRFLTGDHWELRIRGGAPSRPPVDHRAVARAVVPDIGAVALMSGGLDSFIGALDATEQGERLLLISHNAAGSARFSSPAQDAVSGAIQRVGRRPVANLKMNVSPPASGGDDTERSQRSRSIIFVGIGVLAASAYAAGISLVIAENGFIGLNVPMTYGRLGSLSTRTTHPYTLDLMREVLANLGIQVPLVTPYRFLTKGEMLVGCRLQAELLATVHATNSCAHPNERNADSRRPQSHCGYCVPCIIRRSAMHRAGIDDVKRYRFDILTERALLFQSSARRQDARAFEMALARAARRASVTDVLRAGPISGTADAIDAYVRVYREGLDEVSRFLRGRQVF